MTPDQYRKALAKLGVSQEGAADILGIGKRTSQGYALGESDVPEPLAVLLRLVLAGKITRRDLEKHGPAED